MSLTYENENTFIDQCESMLKVRNHLIREIDAALNPVCNKETAMKATELLLDQLNQWQRAHRQLESLANKHHRLNA